MTTALALAIDSLSSNPRQLKAFNTPGHCVVIAPPGSGKTHLLSTRLASDLATKIARPHGAACITLTNPAAAELRTRLNRLEVERRSTLFVGTVHSFALSQIARPFGRVAGLSYVAENAIASSAQVRATFNEAISGHYAAHENTYGIQSTIEYYRKRLVPQSEWTGAERLKAVSTEQRQMLKDNHLIDFDEIVEKSAEIVEDNPVIRDVLACRFRGIYVDEYQDLAPGLDRLVRSLCLREDSGTHLFAVGDPDQAIFGWTGSRADLLFDLAGQPKVSQVLLNRNYRCGDGIITVADKLRPEGYEPPSGNPGGVVNAHFVDGLIAGQSAAASEKVKELVGDGTPLDEIAILCNTNSECNEVAEKLKANAVPYFVRSEAYRLTQATMLVESLACWCAYGREVSGHHLDWLLDTWRQVVDQSADLASQSELVRYLMHADPGAQSLQFLDTLLGFGLKGAADSAQSEDTNELARMRESAVKGELEKASIRALGARARRSDRVEISTMTSSKGLEFDVVIIVGADQQRIPHYLSLKSIEKTWEDRRKFYVSVTRARNIVEIYYSGYIYTKYDRRIDAGASQFLLEMGFPDES